MNHAESRNLTFDDTAPVCVEECSFAVAFVVDKEKHALRFLTGRYAPNRLNGQVVWFPLIGTPISTVDHIYKALNVHLVSMDWSPGQPFKNKEGELSELGYYDFDADFYGEGSKTSQEMVALRALAI